jgi:hypothetical protein
MSRAVHYDHHSHRVWIAGQRCHHGATGAVLAAGGTLGLLSLRLRGLLGLVAAGGVLMAHDWKDRARWFARGWQD